MCSSFHPSSALSSLPPFPLYLACVEQKTSQLLSLCTVWKRRKKEREIFTNTHEIDTCAAVVQNWRRKKNKRGKFASVAQVPQWTFQIDIFVLIFFRCSIFVQIFWRIIFSIQVLTSGDIHDFPVKWYFKSLKFMNFTHTPSWSNFRYDFFSRFNRWLCSSQRRQKRGRRRSCGGEGTSTRHTITFTSSKRAWQFSRAPALTGSGIRGFRALHVFLYHTIFSSLLVHHRWRELCTIWTHMIWILMHCMWRHKWNFHPHFTAHGKFIVDLQLFRAANWVFPAERKETVTHITAESSELHWECFSTIWTILHAQRQISCRHCTFHMQQQPESHYSSPKVFDIRWKNLSDALQGLRLSRLKMCAQISWRMALVVAEHKREWERNFALTKH